MKNNSRGFVDIIVFFLVLLPVFIFVYLAYQKYELKQLSFVEEEKTKSNIVKDEEPIIDISNFKTYISKKLGFSIKYPYELRPIEDDMVAKRRKYINDCDSGIIDGCGGSRWPEYNIDFVNSNNETIYDISIHIEPVSESLVGEAVNGVSFGGISPASKYNGESIPPTMGYGVDKEGFSYIFIGNISDIYSRQFLNTIVKTFQFVEPEKPLKCLWFDEFVGVDLTRPNIDPQWYQKATGFYYSSSTNSCQNTEVYVWVDKGSTALKSANIPFQSNAECITTCVK